MPARNNIGQEIQVWQVNLTHSAATADELARSLSEVERDRARRFKFARDRDRFTICRAALRHILATTLKIDAVALEFSTSPYGKPRLAKGNLHFNISHSGARALIALAYDRELGVDIEEMHPLDEALAIAREFFSPEEAQRLSALTEPATVTRAFFECWTRKEAFIKAIGEGLSHPLDTFCVTFFPDETVELRIGTQTSYRWALVNLDIAPGYRAALVFERLSNASDYRVVHREWEPPSYCGDPLPKT